MSARVAEGRRVVVIGGGLAGLSAALTCADRGARVTLLEARPRLGGATWSSRRDGLWMDNGQHVFLRCCTAYRAFLRRLGVEDRVHLQDRLALPVIAPGPVVHWLRRQPLPSPLHLAASLARFGHLSRGDRLRAARAVRRLGRVDLDAPASDARSFGEWLAEQGQSDAAIDAFWDLLIRPTLNLPARDASLALAAKIFQTGLLEASRNADIGWSRVPLQALHADAAARALERAGVRVATRSPVQRIEGGGAPAVWVDGARLAADSVVLAVPHVEAAALLPAASGIDAAGLRALGRAPIVSLHVVFDRRVTDHPLAAGIGTPLEWIFDRSESAGLDDGGQYLTVSLSAAEPWVGLSRDALGRRLLPEFPRLFPRAAAARVLRFAVTCERAATFRQAPGTRRHRPGFRTAAPGLLLAGAWTDTGWPATMEGAVRSGVAAARVALDDTHTARDERAAA